MAKGQAWLGWISIFLAILALMLAIFPATWAHPSFLLPVAVAALGLTTTAAALAGLLDGPRATPKTRPMLAAWGILGALLGVMGGLGIVATLDSEGTTFTIHNYRGAALVNPSFTCEARDAGVTGSGISSCQFEVPLRGRQQMEVWKAADERSLGPELWLMDDVVVPAPFTWHHVMNPDWDQINRALPGKAANTNMTVHYKGASVAAGDPVGVNVTLHAPSPQDAVQLVCHLAREGTTFSVANSAASSPRAPLDAEEIRTCSLTPPEPGIYRVGYEVLTWIEGTSYRTDSWWSYETMEAR